MPRKRGNGEGSIYKRKNGTWCGAITTGRDPKTGKLKRVYFYGRTRQEVADKLNAALNSLKQGTFVEPHAITVGEWLDTWLTDYMKPKLRPLSFEKYETIIRRYLKPAVGHLKLRDLRPEHLQRLYNEASASGLSSSMVRHIHVVMHGALEQALKNQLVARNVSKATTLPRLKRKEIQPLTMEQVKSLLKTVEHDRLGPAIYLELSTGLRRGELLGLRWQDIDFKAGTLTVRQELELVTSHNPKPGEPKKVVIFQEPKTPSSKRTIPIPNFALTALKKWRVRQKKEKLALGEAYHDHDLVFCEEDGTALKPNVLNYYFICALKRAGLPHIRFHDARHTFATLMLELGEHPKVVQQILGHSRISMTLDTYSHVSLDLEKRAAARLNGVLKSSISRRQ